MLTRNMVLLRAGITGMLCCVGLAAANSKYSTLESRQVGTGAKPTLYPANTLKVPVDHFHNDTIYEPHSSETFDLRFYFDDQFYRPGGPIIILSGAEANAEGSLIFLQKGIIHKLIEATGGLGVVLEHRYYGKSWPTTDSTTANMRFLSSDQSMADMAYWSQNVIFPGHEHEDLTAPSAPHIWYGGSYAGALVALYRKLYPDVTWGAISSSAVTYPITDFVEYYEVTRQYASADCIDAQTKLVNVIDNILLKGDSETKLLLKKTFGLESVDDDANFAMVVTGGRGQYQSFVSLTALGIGAWQSRTWVPAYYKGGFEQYCDNISSTDIEFPTASDLTVDVETLVGKGGWGSESATLVNKMINLVGWVKRTAVSACTTTPSLCFEQWTNPSATIYTNRTFQNDILSWPYQYCTQWGGIPSSDIPADTGELPLVSRLMDEDYNYLICKYAFNITIPPDVDAIRQWGGRRLSYPRLAHVHGEVDNWRPESTMATLSDDETLLNETSTVSEPKILIEGAVHGWDLYGVWENETAPGVPPESVKDAQKEITEFVRAWMQEWEQTKKERQNV